MTEQQKARINFMSRDELQNILIESDLYEAELIEYVKSRMRMLPVNGQDYNSNVTSTAKPSFSSSYISFFKKYADFSGRSTRSEYWFVYLANLIITVITYILLIPNIITLTITDNITGQLVELLVIVGIYFIYQLICVVPNFALSIRRLHDIGKSGWNLLLEIIPVVGAVIMFVYVLTDSEINDNQYGKNPKQYPDNVHKQKSNTVLIVIIVCLIGSIILSACRSYLFIQKHNEMVIDGLFDSDDNYDFDDFDYNYDNDYDYDDSYYELYPTDSQHITYSELSALSKDEVALIRNEIYARHGYVFKTEPYKSYFNEMPWYIPNPNFNENMLTPIEKQNKDTIVQYEKEMGWR